MRRFALVLVLGGCFFEPAKPGGNVPPPPQVGNAQLAAGDRYACSIRPDKSLACWGDDEKGELGASGLTSPAPRTIPGSAWSAIATAGNFACALSNGMPTCWGYYRGTLYDPHLEALPTGLTAAKLFGSDGEMCAITGAGDVYCIGDMYDGGPDGMGGRGVHRLFDSWTKLSIGGTTQVWDSLALGYSSSCAISTAGKAYCWGNDGQYELGVDPATQSARAIEEAIAIPGYTFKRAATGSGGSCAITDTDQLVCWGSGIFGNGGPTVVDTHTWSGITAGFDFVCGIRDGAVWCYGDNTDGALGDGFAPHMPLTASVYDSATEVVAGGDFACATNGTSVSCWGSNEFGELGNGKTATSRTPQAVTLPAGAYSRITVGIDHTCVLVDGKPTCWGGNLLGQAVPMGSPVVPPTQVKNTSYTALAAATDHTCALAGATMDCWGNGDTIGAPGMATHSVMTTSTTWNAIATSDFGSCAAPSDGSAVRCVGDMPSMTLSGELVAAGTNIWASAHASTLTISGRLCGNPDATQTFSALPFPPTAVVAANDTTHLGTPSGHVCFIDSNHDLYCLGPNGTQQVSTASTDCVTSPSKTDPVDTGGWQQVTVNTRHTCALETNGTLYCWGQNDYGELGELADQSPPPTQFSDSRPWAEVSLGEHHACGIAVQDSQVYCWGLNVYGEAGAGEHFHDQPTAVQF